MIKSLLNLHPIIFLIFATIFEVSGDAIIRKGIFDHSGQARFLLMLFGAVCLFLYGFLLNLAPVEFGQVVGLYIATLFIVWQVINFITYHTLPTVPILVGGFFVVLGGMIITFWKY